MNFAYATKITVEKKELTLKIIYLKFLKNTIHIFFKCS